MDRPAEEALGQSQVHRGLQRDRTDRMFPRLDREFLRNLRLAPSLYRRTLAGLHSLCFPVRSIP